MALPDNIARAIRSGPVPTIGRWRKKRIKNLTRAERVMRFIESVCRVPEGRQVGEPLRLELFQQAFIYAIYDNPAGTNNALLSLARKNGKTGLIAALIIAHLDGPEAIQNSELISGAMSRKQAGIVFNLARKMIKLNPELDRRIGIVPSHKRLIGYEMGTEFESLAAEGATAHGHSPVFALLDEMGQVRGATNPFIEAITTSQGAHQNPLLVTISTQAPSDADYLSLQIDDAERNGGPHVVCHVYEGGKDCELTDPAQAAAANPALGKFRGEKDLFSQLERAARVPSLEASARNLLLNQRVSLESLWLAPRIWKENSGEPDLTLFRDPANYIALGLDLSARNDLTAAVLAVCEPSGAVHLLPFVFTPSSGIEGRAARDRAPYTQWAKDGKLITVAGATVSYEQVAEYLRDTFEELEITVSAVEFDRWRIQIFRSAAEEYGLCSEAEWHEVGQGYKDFSPRCESFEAALLSGNIRHGNHPLLNMAAANAIAQRDPAGSIKLAKNLSTQKIDPLVAAVMAVHAVTDGAPAEFDALAIIG